MPDDFQSQSNFKIVVLMISLLLFGVMSYIGYQFITEVERSADDINHEPSFNKSKALDFSHFQNTIALPENRKVKMVSSDGMGTGEDLAIKAGEFAYQYSQPVIRIALYNHGNFAISAISVSLSLFLDSDKEAVANAVGIPIVLSQPLLPEEQAIVSVPVSGEMWQSDMVRRARLRRILVQIISVSNADNQNAEYSQTSQGVYLKQTANDWTTLPQNNNVLPNNDFASTVSGVSDTPPADFVDPTVDMDLTIPKPVDAVPIEPVTELKFDQTMLENASEATSNDNKQSETKNSQDEGETLPSTDDGTTSYEVKVLKKNNLDLLY